MLRPALTLITSEAVGGERTNALKSDWAIYQIVVHLFQNCSTGIDKLRQIAI